MHKKMSQSTHTGLCRINPQTHLYVMKTHCLLHVDRLDFSSSPLRTKRNVASAPSTRHCRLYALE